MEVDPNAALKHLAGKVASLEKESVLTWRMMDNLKDGYLNLKYPGDYSAIVSGRKPVPAEAAAPPPHETDLEDPSMAIMPVDEAEASAWDDMMAVGGEETEAGTTEGVDEPNEPNDEEEKPTVEQPAVEQPTDEHPMASVASDSIKDDQRPDKPRNYRRKAVAVAAAGVLLASGSGLAVLKGGENEAPSAVRPVPESPVAGMLDGRSLPPLMKSIEKSSKENRAENNKNDKGDKSSGSGSVSSDTNTNGRAESAAPRQQTSQGNAGPVETVQTAEPQRRTPSTAPSTEPAPSAPSRPPEPQSTSPFLIESGDPSSAEYGINNQAKADPITGGTLLPR